MLKQRRIVLVEQERPARASHVSLLTAEGFAVEAFADRAEALARFDRSLPDLALLDIHLGDDKEGGFWLCRELRARSRTLPIIFLSRDDNDFDRVTSYCLGADDYVTLDHNPRVLTARIRALLERIAELRNSAGNRHEPAADKLVSGKLLLDCEGLRAYWGERPVTLTVTQFWIVHALASANGEIRSLNELMRAANVQVHPNTITANIARIRKRFSAVDPAFDAIQNSHGRGYRWLG